MRLIVRGSPFEFDEPPGDDPGDDPVIIAIRMVEDLRPAIKGGNTNTALQKLDDLWDHLRDMSPVPTNAV